MKSQKRAVLQMAFGYAGAWLLVWTPWLVLTTSLFVTKFAVPPPDTMWLWMHSTNPLQGFFNFLVFMAPKVRSTRTLSMRRGGRTHGNNNNTNQNQQQNLTWRQAFYKAYMDRGRPHQDRSMGNNNRMEIRVITAALSRRISGRTFRSLFESIKSVLARSTMRTSSPEQVTEPATSV